MFLGIPNEHTPRPQSALFGMYEIDATQTMTIGDKPWIVWGLCSEILHASRDSVVLVCQAVDKTALVHQAIISE